MFFWRLVWLFFSVLGSVRLSSFCHHCHQHYFLPVVNTPAPLSRQIELYCSNCGRAAALNENIHKSVVASHFPLFCPDCHHPLTAQQNITVDLNQTEIVDIGRQKSVGVRSGLIFISVEVFEHLGYAQLACVQFQSR